MKAFEPKNKKYKFYHPEDMKIIIDYLERNGKINIEYELLENLYYDYSDSVLCGWRCVDDESLQQFAEYLSNVELRPGGYKYIDNSYRWSLEED